jgi:hypothetical protein
MASKKKLIDPDNIDLLGKKSAAGALEVRGAGGC